MDQPLVFLTQAEAGEVLQISVRRLASLRKKRRMAFYDTKPLLFAPADLNAFRVAEAARRNALLARRLRLKPVEGSVEYYQACVASMKSKLAMASARYKAAAAVNSDAATLIRLWSRLRMAKAKSYAAAFMLDKALREAEALAGQECADQRQTL